MEEKWTDVTQKQRSIDYAVVHTCILKIGDISAWVKGSRVGLKIIQHQ